MKSHLKKFNSQVLTRKINKILGNMALSYAIICCFVFYVSCKKTNCRIKGDYKFYECKNNFTKMQGVTYFKDKWKVYNCISGGSENQYVINDEISYDSLFCNERPLGEIDFLTQTLLGHQVYTTSKGDEVQFEMNVCIDNINKFCLLHSEYEVNHKCRGSSIDNLYMGFWVSVPKLSSDYKVIFESIEKNTFY